MSARLAGKTVSFTGGFESLTRNEAISAIKKAGAVFQKQVNRNVDVLVTGDSKVGIRALQAQNLGIKIMPASAFQSYVKNQAKANSPAPTSSRGRGRPAGSPNRSSMASADASRFVRSSVAEVEETPRMPWEEEIVPRFGAIPRRGRPSGSPNKKASAVETMSKGRGRPAGSSNAPKTVAAAPKQKSAAKTISFVGTFNFPTQKLSAIAKSNGSEVIPAWKDADAVVFGSGTAIEKFQAKQKGKTVFSELEFLTA